ncbi:unnamed protein product [Urochloa decumbens]|uniref:Uncharacterized protein n=1 Tax=Urochloa decumbens TaxID=240449 RepID=A0ABC9EIV1_9POAL
MALSDSEPCTQPQRPPAQPVAAAADDRAPAAGTSSESDDQAPSAAPVDSSSSEKKKDRAEAAASDGCRVAEPVVPRRPAAEESARERLKRHRTEMAGRVRIPDMWGQERLLKDWVDCAVFDRPLAATAGLLTARDALVAECAAARARRPAVVVGPHAAAPRPLRVQNGCS